MIIRTETQADYERVRQLNIEAFGHRNDEAELVERIRQSDGFIPYLSLVAEAEEGMVGHALFSKASIVNEAGSHEVIVLAPIAVAPSHQKQGIGKRLIEEGLTRSRELGYPGVLLIGHPDYYPRLGFQPARTFGLVLKQFQVPDDVFMAIELRENGLRPLQGELRYPAAFGV
ncbi:GNAT family N-acetyltransferase [Paenibacillus montanisoli]|uniref:N-acetyltransferase n=1 Tax=Paenibacillus montanisoli TaxID=2081970 RepID=A0A328UAN6_9BACL|nr:N-acetyltransferase [Paenibacillus montanisoli]RAP77985.1 N-acetyltransferase [Paenibacillus montanisoli]